MNALKLQFPKFFVVLFVLISSCQPVNLIQDYDPYTDQTIYNVQQKIVSLIVNIENNTTEENATYEAYDEYYRQILVDLNMLEIHTGALEKNAEVHNQVVELISMTKNLMSIHQRGALNNLTIEPIKVGYFEAFKDILALQNALKSQTN